MSPRPMNEALSQIGLPQIARLTRERDRLAAALRECASELEHDRRDNFGQVRESVVSAIMAARAALAEVDRP